jgi:hypothetical protein
MKKPIPQVKWDAIVNLGSRAIQAREKVFAISGPDSQNIANEVAKILKDRRSTNLKRSEMRKILIQIAVLVILWSLLFYLVFAYSASLVINPGPEYSISVGGQSRILRIFYEGDNLILRFFKDDNSRLEFLGEEIFDKDGVKVYDSYLENNGLWPKGYELRFRK